MTLYSDSAIAPIKTSRLTQGQKDNVRKLHINSPHFDPAWIGEGGPINVYQPCSFTNAAYRSSFDGIFGERDIFRNLAMST